MLSHGAVLRKNFFSAEELISIVNDFRNAGLPEVEISVMAFAQKVILEPGEITEDDIILLRELGLQDEEIFDVVLAASARSFFSKALDAVGTEPDEVYMELEPELRKALTVGRPYP